MTLNKRAPYGKICPPEHGVTYTQNGLFYDNQFRQVTEKGEPVEGEAVVTPEQFGAVGDAAAADRMPVADLLKYANIIPFGTFKKEAVKHLGENCGSLKADIVKMLVLLEGKVAPPAGAAGASPVKPKANDPKPTVASNGVDLVAWGTGQKHHLMGDVYKAIREVHSKIVNNERDAVNFLIDANVVPAALARNAASGLSVGDPVED